MNIHSMVVFCGSKSGNNSLYKEHAVQLGYVLAEKSISLIYGGSNKGMMSAIANAVLEKEGKVIGIMPKVLTEWEHHHLGITELIIVEDMHSRKKMLYEKCDAAVIMPGGYGTMDEFFEMLTWNQLNIHDKHIFILNTAGFYNHLIAHIRQMVAEDFLYDELEKRITILNSPDQLLQYL